MVRVESLEGEPQGKFHQPRLVKRVGKGAKGRGSCQGVVAVELHLAHVEPRGVGDVEGFPAEAKVLAFGNLPGLAQAGVNVEGTRTAQVITLSGLARKGQAEVLDCSRRILEDVGQHRTARGGSHQVTSSLRHWSILHHVGSKLPVGAPEAQAGPHTERESAGPAPQAGNGPAAYQRVEHAAHAAAKMLAAADR